MSDPPEKSVEMPAPESGVSLDALSEAFARAMGTAEDVEERSEQPEDETKAALSEEQPSNGDLEEPGETEEPSPEEQEEACCPISPRSIFEAMLFVGDGSNRPLSASRAAELMRGVEPEEIPELVRELNADYRTNNCPYEIHGEEGGYRLRLREKFRHIRERFYGKVRQTRLSQAALDILAIVAYRQPLTADAISKLREHPSGGVLNQLVRRQLLRIERPASKPRKALYYTTDRFLSLFDLDCLDDLPRTEDP